jgi:hypothetical protein
VPRARPSCFARKTLHRADRERKNGVNISERHADHCADGDIELSYRAANVMQDRLQATLIARESGRDWRLILTLDNKNHSIKDNQ